MKHLTFTSFLRDRAVYIAVYAVFGLLAVAVVQLDLRISRASLQIGNLFYIWLLGMAGLFLWLFFDYQRQVEFLRRLEGISPTEPLDELGLLPQARTLEQRLFAQAWTSLYARLRAELTEEQQRGRQNVQLISHWAHHMKTPVAVIDLELQKARKRPPEGLEPVFRSVAEENQRLRHSLQMLLNVVRLEDFAADFRVEPVDLVALVRGVVNDQKREFIAHRVYPRVEAPSDEPGWVWTVQSDAKWLRAVLEQVVSNAIKYSSRPDQDGQVIFRFSRSPAETVLEVADNGIGIAREELGRVFAPFYTGANGREYPQSTGMGLYLARETCQRLGHRISLESRRGEGTQVYLRFANSQTIFAGLQTPDGKMTGV